jgi:hypothetical protein
MRTDDEAYYRARALQEQVAAQCATCEAAREVHDQLAAMYRFRVAMLSRGPSEWAESLQEDRVAETL